MLPEGTRVLSVREPEQRFVFENIGARPVPSLLRDFSAPVIVEYDHTEAELIHLMAHDSDAFNRWDAGQRLALGIILRGIKAARSGGKAGAPKDFFDAFGRLLAGAAKDSAFAAEALALPSEGYIAEQLEVVDPDAIHSARNELRRQLAAAFRDELLEIYLSHGVPGPYSPDADSAGKRALRNAALGFLMEL